MGALFYLMRILMLLVPLRPPALAFYRCGKKHRETKVLAGAWITQMANS
jgi:hypothetical protein